MIASRVALKYPHFTVAYFVDGDRLMTSNKFVHYPDTRGRCWLARAVWRVVADARVERDEAFPVLFMRLA